MSGVTIKLGKPVKAHGEDITELVLREPDVSDTLDLGMPFAIDASGDSSEIVFRTPVIARYAVRLAGVPMGTIKSLSINDWLAVQGAVQGFFGRSDDAASNSSPTEPSMSPSS